MNKKQSRFFCLTAWIEPEWDKEDMNYLIYQKELCPTTNKEHFQCYVEFYKKKTIMGCKKYFDNTTHIEIRRGTQEQAIEYCSKEDTKIDRLQIFGIPAGGQGSRTDLSNLIEAMKQGAEIDDIYELYPEMCIKYNNGVHKYMNYMYKKHLKSWRPVETTVIIGKAGGGKTKYVYDNHNYNDIFKLTESMVCGDRVWWDGYSNEKVLLIDDFNGWIKYKTLLNMLDGYPLLVQNKGGSVYVQYERVYITTNEKVDTWYHEIEALKRRIKNTMYIPGKKLFFRQSENDSEDVSETETE